MQKLFRSSTSRAKLYCVDPVVGSPQPHSSHDYSDSREATGTKASKVKPGLTKRVPKSRIWVALFTLLGSDEQLHFWKNDELEHFRALGGVVVPRGVHPWLQAKLFGAE